MKITVALMKRTKAPIIINKYPNGIIKKNGSWRYPFESTYESENVAMIKKQPPRINGKIYKSFFI